MSSDQLIRDESPTAAMPTFGRQWGRRSVCWLECRKEERLVAGDQSDRCRPGFLLFRVLGPHSRSFKLASIPRFPDSRLWKEQNFQVQQLLSLTQIARPNVGGCTNRCFDLVFRSLCKLRNCPEIRSRFLCSGWAQAFRLSQHSTARAVPLQTELVRDQSESGDDRNRTCTPCGN